jgi:hypothetical protein
LAVVLEEHRRIGERKRREKKVDLISNWKSKKEIVKKSPEELKMKI